MIKELKLKLGELLIDLSFGNTNALTEIYLIMDRVLYKIGNYHYANKADVEDAIQNLLELLVDKSCKFHKNDNAYAWIIKIYVHSILNHKVQLQVENKYRELEYEKLKLNKSIDGDKYLENYVFIRELVSYFCEYEQKLIFYRFYCEFSLSEIAKLVKKPKSTIQSQMLKIEERIKSY